MHSDYIQAEIGKSCIPSAKRVSCVSIANAKVGLGNLNVCPKGRTYENSEIKNGCTHAQESVRNIQSTESSEVETRVVLMLLHRPNRQAHSTLRRRSDIANGRAQHQAHHAQRSGASARELMLASRSNHQAHGTLRWRSDIASI